MRIVVLLIGIALLMTGCTAGPNPAVNTVIDGTTAGFLLGLWHGMIAPITFVISCFDNSMNLYEIHNNGASYNFGFLCGIYGVVVVRLKLKVRV